MSPLKRKLTFLIVIAAVAACAAGAFAATQSSSTSPRQAFFNDVAHRLHVTPLQLKKAMQGAFADRLAALVASGRLTKAQASAIEARMKASGRYPGAGLFGIAAFGRGMRRGFGPAGFGPGLFAPAPVPGMKLRPGQKLPPNARPGAVLPPGFMAPVPQAHAVPFGLLGGAVFGFFAPGGIKAGLNYLGLRPAQLIAQLRAGRTLAQIAKAHGKSVSGLESAVESKFKARLSRQVAAKHLTKAQAGKIASAIDARIAALMNVKLSPFPARFRSLHRFRAFPHGAAQKKLGALFSSA